MALDEHWPWDDTPVVLVTGAARGLGLAVAEALAGRGATVLVSARHAADARQAAEQAGVAGLQALPVDLDVADTDAVAAAARAVADGHGRLDVLVNNAAAYVDWAETASGADLARSKEVMATNLYGAWATLQAFLPLLQAGPHPRVVNMASGAGSHGDPAYGLTARHGAAASSGVSKAALLALTATWPGAEGMGARPIADSVAGIVWAATLPDDGPRGGFFRDGLPHPW